MGRYLEVRTIGDVEQHLAAIRASAARAQGWIAAQSGDPLDLLRRMKFEPVGFHPIEDRPLNVIEQLNSDPIAFGSSLSWSNPSAITVVSNAAANEWLVV